MNAKFHTPSLGDENLDLTECDAGPDLTNTEALAAPNLTPQAHDYYAANQTKISNSQVAADTAQESNTYHPMVTLAARKYIKPTVKPTAATVCDEKENGNGSAPTLQTKPAIFTIMPTDTASEEPPFSNTNNNLVQQQQRLQQRTQAEIELFGETTAKLKATCIESAAEKAAKTSTEQMLTEASAVRKCTRDGCNKRAIINPDWEDEYCSNECVVLHCRSVFTSWVKSNLDSDATPQ